jgi:hypothetical protein
MADATEEAREAAVRASDPNRLLPGEDPASTHPDDAVHWIEVYRELLSYKERLLAVTEETIHLMPEEPARREAAETDQVIITAERDRFARRLAYWTRRQSELGP